MPYKVSVIIPTYNAEKYLLNSVNSIINQSIGFENIELILVDDNSNDATPNIIKNLSEKYTNIISVLSKKNTGTASEPRNIGIQNASADYIMFLDNDDEYYEDTCEVLYNAITNNNVDIVTCRYDMFKNNKLIKPKSFLDKYPDILEFDDINEFPELLTLGFPTMIWTKIFRKELILSNNIKFPKGHLYEDVYFTSKYYINTSNILILNNFVGYKYNVRIEDGNKSTSQNFNKALVEKQLNGFLDVMNLIKDDENKYSFLFNEMVVDMSKIYIYSDLDNAYQKYVVEVLSEFYKKYSIFSRIHTASLPFNILINIFIVLFSKSNKLMIFVSNLYTRIHK